MKRGQGQTAQNKLYVYIIILYIYIIYYIMLYYAIIYHTNKGKKWSSVELRRKKLQNNHVLNCVKESLRVLEKVAKVQIAEKSVKKMSGVKLG